MTRARRRCLLSGMLMLVGVAAAACAATGPAAQLEPRPVLRPAPGESYLDLGTRLLAGNEPALAMRAFNASLGIEGISARALTGAGIAAQRQGMLGAAREYLEHARTLSPNSAIAHGNLGMVLIALKDYHGARTAFRSALALSAEGESGNIEGGNATLRRNLERAEMAIAALEADRRGDPAATQRVVRLGSDSFRLTERTEGGATAASLLDATSPGPSRGSGDAAVADEAAGPSRLAASGTPAANGASASGASPAPADRRAADLAAHGIPATAEGVDADAGDAGSETAVLAAEATENGAD